MHTLFYVELIEYFLYFIFKNNMLFDFQYRFIIMFYGDIFWRFAKNVITLQVITKNLVHTNMEEKKLTYQDVPIGYPLCFNDECAKKACCMHYQARLLMPMERYTGSAVYPTAWQDGTCKCFREKQLVWKAWGFTHIYDNVPQRDRAEARRHVKGYFSGGNGPYYRYHHGENRLSPKQQQDILGILESYGSIDGIRFDEYVQDWDFE